MIPASKWQFNSRFNFTIPLFARGPGSELLLPLSDGLDQITLDGRTFGNGAYLDQTELFGAFVNAIRERCSIALLVPAAMVLRRRR